MMRTSLRSLVLFRRLAPYLQPAAFGSLLAVVGTGLACSSSDGPAGGSAGKNAATGGAGPGTGTGGGPGTAGASPSGGTGGNGTAGTGTAGTAPAAGSGGSGSGFAGGGSVAGGSGVAGGSSVAGGSTGGASGGSAGSGTAGSGAGGAGSTHWVGTWTASPYATAADGQPPNNLSLSNAVARQITHASLGGNQIRVQFTNKEGKAPLVIKSAHVALCKATPLVDGSIDVATDKALAFSGMPGVTIAAGMELWSDPVDFVLPALGNVSITTAFGSVPADITSHNGARTDSYVVANSTDVSAPNLTSAPHNQHWWFISGMDVMAPAAARGIVAIGDSITDGRGVTPNANNRWTDVLAARLQANAATANVSIMNQGIGATNLIGTGTAAEARFARDVLGQSGVKYVIIFDGVNDIGGTNNATFAAMKPVYDKLIKAGRDKSLLVYGATILPFGGNSYWSTAHEAVRKEVNTYIKSGAFDGYIDFDAAVTDGKTGTNAPSLLPATNSADALHPGPEGYKMMGDKVDLTLFTK